MSNGKANLQRLCIGDFAQIKSGGTPDRNVADYWLDGQIPWVTTTEVNYRTIRNTKQFITQAGLQNSSARIFPAGTLLLALYGQGKTRGQVARLGIDAATNQACAAIIPDERVRTDYLFYFLQYSYGKLREFSNSGGQDNLSGELVSQFPILFPEITHQITIAEILQTWDEAIETCQKLLLKKIEQTTWFRTHLFTGKVRLKGFAQDWKLVSLAEVLTEHGMRSSGAEQVFSVSVHKGLINQIEHLGRSFAAKDTSHYNRVLPGDIVYTKSPTGEFPLGIIKQSAVAQDVIVSPLYGVFTPVTSDLGLILDAYFRSPVTVRNYLAPLIQKGAKNTIAITNSRFLEGKLNLPLDPEEQSAIARIVRDSDTEIAVLNRQLTALHRQKMGLMRKLFVGDWLASSKAKGAA